MNSWQRRGRIGLGALLALLLGWSAVAFGIWLTIVISNYLDPTPVLFPPTELLLGFGVPWLVAFPLIGFAMGVVCAFFWRSLAPMEQQRHWTIGLLLVFCLPTSLLGLGGFCFLTIEFPLMLFTLRRGLESRPRWSSFFGLTNQWERDPDAKPEPPHSG